MCVFKVSVTYHIQSVFNKLVLTAILEFLIHDFKKINTWHKLQKHSGSYGITYNVSLCGHGLWLCCCIFPCKEEQILLFVLWRPCISYLSIHFQSLKYWRARFCLLPSSNPATKKIIDNVSKWVVLNFPIYIVRT